MSRGQVPTKKPNTRTINYGAEVRRAWGDAWLQKETAYRFSNGREFNDPGSQGGPYTGTAGNG